MVKSKSKIFIAITLIAIITFSLFGYALAEHLKGRSSGKLPEPSAMNASLNVKLEDKNGTLPDGDKTDEGVAIATADELKNFIGGEAMKGYLTADITNFNWGTHGSDAQFGVNRVLDGNGHTVTISAPRSSSEYQMIDKFVMLNWRNVLNEKDGGSYSHKIGASGPFLAVNQGTIKNINFIADFVPDGSNGGGLYGYEWVPSRDRGNRDANSVALSFGMVAGVNFGEMTNCTVDYKAGSRMRIQNLNGYSSQWCAKENQNHLEAGLFAGCNSGSISFATANMNGYIQLLSRSSNSATISTGKASARSMFGIIAGRMQSDKNVDINKAKIATATIYNSIVSGSGTIDLQAISCGGTVTGAGDKGDSFNHVGAVAGGNSPYSGTIVNRDTEQSYGIIDGIISTYRGDVPQASFNNWHKQGSTSGGAPSQKYRAMIDCGKISNVTFLDRYDGHIDNCQCVGGEHIATRANGFSASLGDAEIKVGFDREATSVATLVINVNPTHVNGKIPEEKVMYALNRRDRQVDEHSNAISKVAVPMFNYNNANFYNYVYDELGQVSNKTDILATGKLAEIRIVEPREANDKDSFILDVEIGTLVKTEFDIASEGKFSSEDRLEGAMDTFTYDGMEKGIAKFVNWYDADGQDTFTETTKYRKFVSQYRQENENQYNNYDMGLLYPGVYKDIYIQSTMSAHQSYVDPINRILSPILKNVAGEIVKSKLKISPAKIVVTDTNSKLNYGVQDLNNDIEANDVSPSKLSIDTVAGYKFNFSVYTRKDKNSPRVELKSKMVDEVRVLPYDRIEFSQEGYVYQTAVTFDEVTGGFYVNDTTALDGRAYFFRAVKDLKDANGNIITTTSVTVDSSMYVLIIDGTAPLLEAKVNAENGVDFKSWAEKNTWKSDPFDLYFKVSDLSVEGLSMKVKSLNQDDSLATDMATTNVGEGYINVKNNFADNLTKVFFAYDKYGNRSLDYVVAPKVDTITPDFNTSAYLENVNHNGVLELDNITVSDGGVPTLFTGKLVSSRNSIIKVNNLNASAPSVADYVYTYKFNDGEWKTMTSQQFLSDRVNNLNYYKVQGGDRSVYDKLQIRVTSGSGLYKDITVNTQINKALLLVDQDKIIISDGGWESSGIREDHLLKRYTGNNALPAVLTKALEQYFNQEIAIVEGQERVGNDRVVVKGSYAQVNVGVDIPMTIDVVDPLGRFTIDATTIVLNGTIVPKAVTVRVYDATREYGSAEPIFKYEVNGTLGNDRVNLDRMIYPTSDVTINSPAGRSYSVVLPAKGTQVGNYVIEKVTNFAGGNDVKINIVPKVLNTIEYDDSFLSFAYFGGEHNVIAKYQEPNGGWKNLNVRYLSLVDGNEIAFEGKPVEIGKYIAQFSISDPNYTLEERRSRIEFEVHKGVVSMEVPESQLNLKYNGNDRVVVPILSNGSVPVITYYDSLGGLIYDTSNPGVGYLPNEAGNYTVRIEYLNVNDVESKRGKYYDIVKTHNMSIGKVTYAEVGLEMNSISKVFDNKTSEVILYNVPFGTSIPSDIMSKPGPVENSYIILTAKDTGKYVKSFTLENRNIFNQEFTATINISKASFKNNGVKLTSSEVNYDGNAHSIELLNMPSDIDVKITNVVGTSIGVEVIDNKITMSDAGEYNAILRLSNKNFLDETFNGKLNIKRAKMDGVRVDNVKVEYDGKEHGTIVYGVPSDLNMAVKTTVTVQFAGTKPIEIEPIDAARTMWRVPGLVKSGIHNLRVNVKNANYEAKSMDATLRIDLTTYEKLGTTINSRTIDYDGNVHRLEVVDMPVGTEVFDANGVKIDSYIEAIEAGTYELAVKLSNPNVQDNVNLLKGSLTINKGNLDTSYTLNGLTKDYDGQNVEVVFDKSQLKDGSTFSVKDINGMLINDNVLTFCDAGTYNIEITVRHPNYSDSVVQATVIINKINAPYLNNVKFPDKTVAYNGDKHSISIEGLEGYEGVNVVARYNDSTNNDPINIGEYNCKITISHKNYLDIDGSAKLVINKAKMTELEGSRVLSSVVNYDGNGHSLKVVDAKGKNLNNSYTVQITYNDLPVGVLPIDAGIYKAKAVVSKLNYEDFAVTYSGELEILKLQSPELKVEDINRAYNGKAVKFAVKRTDGESIGSHTVKIRVDNKNVSELINVGSYNCELIISQTNYEDVKLNVKVNITPVVVEVTYTNIENLVAGKDNTLKGTFTDIENNTVEVKFKYQDGYDPNKPGTYRALAIVDETGNYVASETTAIIEFEVKGGNVGAIAGGSAGGAAAVGVSVALFFVLKRKRIKL